MLKNVFPNEHKINAAIQLCLVTPTNVNPMRKIARQLSTLLSSNFSAFIPQLRFMPLNYITSPSCHHKTNNNKILSQVKFKQRTREKKEENKRNNSHD